MNESEDRNEYNYWKFDSALIVRSDYLVSEVFRKGTNAVLKTIEPGDKIRVEIPLRHPSYAVSGYVNARYGTITNLTTGESCEKSITTIGYLLNRFVLVLVNQEGGNRMFSDSELLTVGAALKDRMNLCDQKISTTDNEKEMKELLQEWKKCCDLLSRITETLIDKKNS